MERNLFSRLTAGQRITGLAVALTIAAGVPALALAQSSTVPKTIGKPVAGKKVFLTNCVACHRLKAAGSVGTIGPNLDKTKLTEAVLVKAITNGGAAVMTKAQLAKYPSRMTPYKGVLTKVQIQNTAAFIFVSTHK